MEQFFDTSLKALVFSGLFNISQPRGTFFSLAGQIAFIASAKKFCWKVRVERSFSKFVLSLHGLNVEKPLPVESPNEFPRIEPIASNAAINAEEIDLVEYVLLSLLLCWIVVDFPRLGVWVVVRRIQQIEEKEMIVCNDLLFHRGKVYALPDWHSLACQLYYQRIIGVDDTVHGYWKYFACGVIEKRFRHAFSTIGRKKETTAWSTTGGCAIGGKVWLFYYFQMWRPEKRKRSLRFLEKKDLLSRSSIFFW